MKATTKTLSFGMVLALALALAQFGSRPLSAQQSDRAKRLGGKLICMCNCNQILTACNHVGCTVSSAMLKEMDQRVTRNDPDDLTLQSFVQEYGEKVLAEPPSKGFNSLAWYIPGIAFVLGLGIVVLVISSWRRRIAVAPAGPPVSPEMLARARQQADRETEE
jgi:cytochrome c-type biogenesis protein CcmH/NrfF